MSTNTASSTATKPSSNQYQPDPLLRGGSYIDPVGEAPPSSSGNGAPPPRKTVPRPPEPGSEIASWLPEGWLVEERWRTSGATAGTVDKYYFDPKTNRRFRSKKEVQYYMETGTVRKKRGAETSENPSDVPGSQKKKPGTKTQPIAFDPSNVPESVEWCLTDAAEDTWTPSINGSEVSKQEVEGWKVEFASRTAKSSSESSFSKDQKLE